MFGEDYGEPVPSTLIFLSSTTVNMDTLCTEVAIVNDANYEGVHTFQAEILDSLLDQHISIGSPTTISIIDDGMC